MDEAVIVKRKCPELSKVVQEMGDAPSVFLQNCFPDEQESEREEY